MTTKTQARAPWAFLLSEAAGARSRSSLLIAASMTILSGQVLGKVGVNEGAITVGAGVLTGTGNGTLTLGTPAYGVGAQEGDYKVIAVEKTTDSAEFIVRRPDGTVDGRAVVGTLYDGQIRFTANDGSTDYDQTSIWTVNVAIAAATDEARYKNLNLAASDGAEVAVAIAGYKVTTGVSETIKIAGVERDCEVISAELEWPVGITDDQKAVAVAQLAASGIIVR